MRLLQIVAQLLSFPLGRLWARVVPNVKIFGVSINPGPFTVKEHVLITMMATVGYQSAYAVSIMARTIYFREANLALDGYYCGPASVLQSNLQLRLPMDGGHEYTTCEFLPQRER